MAPHALKLVEIFVFTDRKKLSIQWLHVMASFCNRKLFTFFTLITQLHLFALFGNGLNTAGSEVTTSKFPMRSQLTTHYLNKAMATKWLGGIMSC